LSQRITFKENIDAYLLMHKQGGRHQISAVLLNGKRKCHISEVLRKYATVDCLYSVRAGKAESEHAEVSLETGIYGETPRGRVHTGHVLGVVDLLEGELVTVVPVAIVEMLAYQHVGLDCEKSIDLIIAQI